MPLTPGTKLAQYEVVEAIGAGGMGEVYRARDTKLGRDVAIKVLPEEFARDKERLDRFEREARLLAQLNHSNIATLYGLEEHDGQKFIVMELVEGETLAERIAKGPIPIDEAIPLFIQIAEGLEAAHEKAIIHRDLKPPNIKIGPDGKPKILDFGLAKAFAPDDDVSAAASQSPTLTKGTALGAILGTASYMSPEQARGQEVDKRTDIWAYGCCFYETLTAKKAFTGDSVTDILAAVVRGEPELGALARETTPGIRKLLRRCFSKGVRERLRDIGEARIALTESLEAPAGLEEAEPARRSRVGIAAALFVVLATGALIGRYVVPSRSSDDVERGRVSRSSLRLPPDQRIPGNILSPLAISPEGERIAYVALRGGEQRLFIRELDSFESTELDGTEDAEAPFFSPNGRWVGFFARRMLFKVAVGGGSPVAIADAPFGSGASWGSNDEIIFAASTQSGLQRVSANGGEPSQLTTPSAEGGSRAHAFPQHLPGGKSVLFTLVGQQFQTAILSLATGEWRPILTGDRQALYVRGHLLFSRPGHAAVMASSFDPVTMALGQNHVPILAGVRADHATNRFSLSASRTGSLAYVPSSLTSVGLVWVDRQGQSRPLEGNLLANPSSISVSPNGQYAAVREGETIWVVDLERGTGTIVVGKSPAEGRFQTPIWTTDGTRITFSCTIFSSNWDLCWAPRSGGETELLLARAGAQVPHSWSPNGELLFGEARGSGADILVMLPGGEISPVVATEANEATAEFSPDGRWIAYGSDETGRDEVYVRSYPEGTTFQRVSEQGGVAPRWSGDGDELFYRSGIRMMAVAIETEPELKLGIPRVLFEEPFELNPYVTLDEQPNYDVAPEGDRFLMVSDRSVGEIKLILNWDEELERLVPSEN